MCSVSVAFTCKKYIPPAAKSAGATEIDIPSLSVVVLLGGIATPYLSRMLYTPLEIDSTSAG